MTWGDRAGSGLPVIARGDSTPGGPLARHPEDQRGRRGRPQRAATEQSRDALSGSRSPGALLPGLLGFSWAPSSGVPGLGSQPLLSLPNFPHPLGPAGSCFGNRIFIPPSTK